ncbi:uncharacterized protein N7498_003051 [Penicillium cinerascens]|uniref:Uncharacterized protein n=1 Tax=Penicillium cinerascens TaxID=70096 RepID=A0A9W9NB97_9EURO|nr:uncharacterized protein N7498_003051 [Penicillium cinerascens]KAJ5216644.1 hypothetical protein N7498_003051 [Penicillium cinerascens]
MPRDLLDVSKVDEHGIIHLARRHFTVLYSDENYIIEIQDFDKGVWTILLSAASIAYHKTRKLVEFRWRVYYSNYPPTTHLTTTSLVLISSGLDVTFVLSFHQNNTVEMRCRPIRLEKSHTIMTKVPPH